ncbi:MAG: DUF4129 domain-containing protein [Gemmatimonadota bacterium]|nr:MAG: DUF4129 domain-containing protein [Gemmatimonadota bacterium]
MMSPGPAQSSEAIRDALQQVFSGPEYQWDQPRSLFDVVGGWLNDVVEALQRLHASHPLGYYILVGLLTAVLLAVLTHFAYVLWQVVKPQPKPTPQATDRTSGSRGPRWYLHRAHQLMLSGQYVEALGFRFRSLVLTLDRRQVLSFHPSKTPAEYLSEVKLDSEAENAFMYLVMELYRHVFGAVPCTAADVQRFHATAAALEGHAPSR